MSQIEDIIAKAWDAEEAAQMGEPSPWKVGPFGLDPDWTSGRHACATAAIRALEAAGFVIVSKEATDDMLEAGAKGSGEDSEVAAGGAWEAMIGARPK